ncbi:MAG: WG repeat-containing protein [Muribaculaceae bacterium]|nr:WG repeat-containing protein [Muribaculaceae bacterium]
MKIKNILGSIAVGLMMYGCGSSDTVSYYDRIDYFPVKESANGNWSFFGQDGELKYPNEFKNMPSPVVNGYFTVEENNGYSVYKAGEKPELVNDAEGLYSVGVMSEGVMPVTYPKERISLINGRGEKIATLDPVKGREIVSCKSEFSDGLLLIQTEDDLYGFIDKTGQLVVSPKYDYAWKFSEGLALVKIESEKYNFQTEYIIIDKDGNQVYKLPEGFTPQINWYNYGFLLVQDRNDHIVFIDKNGEKAYICPNKVKSVNNYNSEYFVFRNDDGYYGVMDFDFNVVIRPKYDRIMIMGNDKFLASEGDNYYVLDKDGNQSVKFDEYEFVAWTGKWNFIARDKHTFCFLNAEGKMIKNSEFDDVNPNIPAAHVRSDYLKVSDIVSDIVAMVNDEGIGKYALNDTPSVHFTNPEKYLDISSVELEDLKKEGSRYEIKVTADFAAPMGAEDWEFDINSWDYFKYYHWNFGAKITSFEISIETAANWDNSCSIALTDGFMNDGYKLVAKNENKNFYFALLRKGKMLLMVGNERDDSGGVIIYEYSKLIEEVFKRTIMAYKSQDDLARRKGQIEREVIESLKADTVSADTSRFDEAAPPAWGY